MSSILHRCPYCGYEAETANSLPAFAENPHCRQCGLSASEGDIKMANDLAALFARQMKVESVPQAGTPHTATPSTPDSSSSSLPPQCSAPPTVYSITQHYHHSSHQVFPVVPPGQQETLPSASSSSNVSPEEEMLRRHDIDPSSLFPSQVALFKQAEPEQRTRLVELWRISPARRGNPSSDDRSMASSNGVHGTEGIGAGRGLLSLDASGNPGGPVTAAAPGSRDDDEMMDMDVGDDDYDHAEPYVVAGYESLAQREEGGSHQTTSGTEASSTATYSQSTDPVFKGHESWQQPSAEHQSMEDQYGAFQMRDMYFGCGVRRPHWLGGDEML